MSANNFTSNRLWSYWFSCKNDKWLLRIIFFKRQSRAKKVQNWLLIKKKREKCIWFFKLQTIISLFKIQFLKHYWGEAHERFERVRVFHAHPFSSFSRNSYRDLRWVRGSHSTEEKSKLAETVTFRKKIFSKISFFFLSVLGTASLNFGYGVPNFGYGVPNFGYGNFGYVSARRPL